MPDGILAPPSLAITRYGLAALAIVSIAVLRAVLFGGFPAFFLYTPAVVIIALFLGNGAGVFAAILATIGVAIVFLDIDPVGSLSPMQWAITASFAATALALVGLVASLRDALETANASQAVIAGNAGLVAEREAFLAGVLSSSTDCIKVLDRDGRLTFMSEGGQRVMEVSDFNAIAGCPWPDFWAGGGHGEAVAAIKGAREGQSSSFVGRASTMAGTLKWWHVAVSPIFGPDGGTDRILSVSRDITALRESEARAQANAERVQLALSAGAIIGTWFWDIPSDRFTIDEAFARAFGLNPALGREGIPLAQIVETVHPEDQAGLAAAIAEAIQRGGRYAHQYRVRRHDGHYYWLEANGHVDHGPDGTPLSFPGVLLDVEERRTAQEALRASEEHYRSLFENIDAGFCTIEMAFDEELRAVDYRFLEVNPAFVAQTGLADAVGRWMREMAPGHEQHWFDTFGQVALSGEPVRFEHEASALGRWYDVHAYRVGEIGARQVAILFNDVTARRSAEEDLQLMNGELAHRLKNVLAVVQSVAHQTLRNATDTKRASSDLSSRLVALGAATGVLTGTAWRSADFREIAERALSPHGSLGKRIKLDGPRLTLKPNVAVALALAMHELATNATKYGALSTDAGTVDVRWRTSGEGLASRFELVWQESGGPPVTEPTRRGFGTTLIERSLRSYFGGTATSEFRPEGLVFVLSAPLGEAAVAEMEA